MSVWVSVPCYAIQEEHPHRLCGLGSSAAPTSRSIVPGSPKAVASEKEKAPPMSQGTGRPLGSQPLSQLLEIRPPPACLSSLCGKSTTLILKQPKESKESKGGRPGGSSGSTHSPRRREGLSSTRSPPPHCWGDRHRPRRLI